MSPEISVEIVPETPEEKIRNKLTVIGLWLRHFYEEGDHLSEEDFLKGRIAIKTANEKLTKLLEQHHQVYNPSTNSLLQEGDNGRNPKPLL